MKTQHYVNEEKRTIVVAVVDCEEDVIRKVRRRLNNRFGESFEFIGDKSFLPEKIIAKAKCDSEDVWDEEFGIHLAEDRVMDKYKRMVNRELLYLLAELEEMKEEVIALLHKNEEGFAL